MARLKVLSPQITTAIDETGCTRLELHYTVIQNYSKNRKNALIFCTGSESSNSKSTKFSGISFNTFEARMCDPAQLRIPSVGIRSKVAIVIMNLKKYFVLAGINKSNIG